MGKRDLSRYKNNEPYIATYLHRKGVAMGIPIAGNFELTPRCNFNCKMCYVHLSSKEVEKRGKELTADQWLNIAEKAKEQGMMFLLLTGGEPLIRKDFLYIYRELKKMGFMISINSNGSLIKGEILECFKENPPYRLNISLYGGSDSTYERLCGRAEYTRVINNIKAIKDLGISVRLNVSITPDNKEDISLIYKKARELNVHIKSTTYMYPPIRINEKAIGCNSHRFTAEEAAHWKLHCDRERYTIEEMNRYRDNITETISSETSYLEENQEGVSCRAGRSSFWITWDGRMLPCGMMVEPIAYPLKDGFKEAWKYIKEATKTIMLPKKCIMCNKRSLCPVCAAVCYSETGAFNKVPKYLCTMTEKVIEGILKEFQ